MQIIILDSHPLQDSRINRHINFMHEHEYAYNIFRLNIDRSLSNKNSGVASHTNIPCFRIGCAYTGCNILNKIYYNIKRFFINDENIDNIISCLGISFLTPTVIHVHDPVLLSFAVKLRGYFGKAKIVYDRHEVYESRTKYLSLIPLPKVGRIAEMLTFKKIDGVVIVLEDYRNLVQQFFPYSKIAVVPNLPVLEDYDDAIILSKIEEFNLSTTIQFVYVGSLNWNHDRDIGLILDIAKHLLIKQYTVRFIVGGVTSDEQLLSEFYHLNKAYPNNFIYTGYLSRDKVVKYTQDAHFGFLLIKPYTDYWVLTSPNKIFEYLKCGVIPIIRAKCACKEQIQNKSLWFEREDSRDFIISTIESIISNPEKIQAMMYQVYQLSSHYSFNSVAHEYLALYEAIEVKNVDKPKK